VTLFCKPDNVTSQEDIILIVLAERLSSVAACDSVVIRISFLCRTLPFISCGERNKIKVYFFLNSVASYIKISSYCRQVHFLYEHQFEKLK
jgi:hypothetical protein